MKSKISLANNRLQSNRHNTHIITFSTISNHSYKLDSNSIQFEDEEVYTPEELINKNKENETKSEYGFESDEFEVITTNLVYINQENITTAQANTTLLLDKNKEEEFGITTKTKIVKKVKRLKPIKKAWKLSRFTIEQNSFEYQFNALKENKVKITQNKDKDENESDNLNESLLKEITQHKFDEVSEDEFKKLKTNLVFESDNNMLADNCSNNSSNNKENNAGEDKDYNRNQNQSENEDEENPVINLKGILQKEKKQPIKSVRKSNKEKIHKSLSKTQSPKSEKKQSRNKENKENFSRDDTPTSFKRINKQSNSKDKKQSAGKLEKDINNNDNFDSKVKQTSKHKIKSDKSEDFEESNNYDREEPNTNQDNVKRKQQFKKKIPKIHNNVNVKYKNQKEKKFKESSPHLKKKSKFPENKDKTVNNFNKKTKSEMGKKKFVNNNNKLPRVKDKSIHCIRDKDIVCSDSINLLTPSYNKNKFQIANNGLSSSKVVDQLAPGTLIYKQSNINEENDNKDKNSNSFKELPNNALENTKIPFSNAKIKKKLKSIANKPKEEKEPKRHLLYNRSTKNLRNKTINAFPLQKTRNRVLSFDQNNKKQHLKQSVNTSQSKAGGYAYSNIKGNDNNSIDVYKIKNFQSNKSKSKGKSNSNHLSANYNQKQKSKKLSNASTNLSKVHQTPESSVKNHFKTKTFGKTKTNQIENYSSRNRLNPKTKNNNKNDIDNCYTTNNEPVMVRSNKKIIKSKVNTRNKSPLENYKNMSNTQDDIVQTSFNKNKFLSKNNNTVDHCNQPFARYNSYTTLRDLNNQKDTAKLLSYDKATSKEKFKRKLTLTKDDFSQTHIMNFYSQSKRLMSNITQKQFDEKMKYYKRLMKNPLNPYSAYYNTRFLMPQIPQIRYDNKAFSVLMPNFQDKTLIKSNSGLLSTKNVHEIKTIYPNMTAHSFWNQSNRMNPLTSKNNNKQKKAEYIDKNAFLIK